MRSIKTYQNLNCLRYVINIEGLIHAQVSFISFVLIYWYFWELVQKSLFSNDTLELNTTLTGSHLLTIAPSFDSPIVVLCVWAGAILVPVRPTMTRSQQSARWLVGRRYVWPDAGEVERERGLCGSSAAPSRHIGHHGPTAAPHDQHGVGRV